MEDDNGGLSDAEIALTDAVMTMAEVFLSRNIVSPATLAKMFAHQRDGYRKKGMVNAALVMDLLHDFSADPVRAAEREALRKILEEPPQGSA